MGFTWDGKANTSSELLTVFTGGSWLAANKWTVGYWAQRCTGVLRQGTHRWTGCSRHFAHRCTSKLGWKTSHAIVIFGTHDHVTNQWQSNLASIFQRQMTSMRTDCLLQGAHPLGFPTGRPVGQIWESFPWPEYLGSSWRWQRHHSSNSNWILIKKYLFKCTSIWTSIIKRLWKGKKMFKVALKLQRYFVIYIRSPLKMQKIIKETSPCR